MKTLKMFKLAAVVVGFISVGSAYAVDLTFNDPSVIVAPDNRSFGNAYNLTAGGLEADTHGNFAAASTGSFTDIYDFTLAAGTLVGASIISTEWAPNQLNISNLHAAIWNAAGTTLLFDGVASTTVGLTTFTTVGGSSAADFSPAGAYKLEITGNIVGVQGGAYGGTFSAAAVTPVPEPEIYGMLVSGLGLMGFVANRRKRKAA